MLALVVRRTLAAAVIVFLVATLSFALVHAAPGEPFAAIREDPRASAELAGRIRAQYGLDRPLGEQYGLYIGRLMRGDLGESFLQRRPVRAVLADALPNTLILMTTALVAAVAHCETAKDFVSREIVVDILEDAEEHIDFLETELSLVDKVGEQNYLQTQIGEGKESS